MHQKIVSIYKLKERYGRLMDNAEVILAATRTDCPYRLMNIFFSDRFSEGLAQHGNVADWAELNTGKVANNQFFWEGV